MNEYIVTFLAVDETISLLVVKPLYCASHFESTSTKNIKTRRLPLSD